MKNRRFGLNCRILCHSKGMHNLRASEACEACESDVRGTQVSLKNTPVSLKSTPVSLNSTQVSFK